MLHKLNNKKKERAAIKTLAKANNIEDFMFIVIKHYDNICELEDLEEARSRSRDTSL